MLKNPGLKYRRFPPIELPNRQWPGRSLKHAPIWCSVDLRDGNQALAVPMNVSQKLELFQALVSCGFKEIEVGFPSASNTEFAFNRLLIEKDHIPDDVTIQVLVQAREDLIEKTVQSLVGAKRVIIHLYNSTSLAQRRVVFGKSKDEIKGIAVQGAVLLVQRDHLLHGRAGEHAVQRRREVLNAQVAHAAASPERQTWSTYSRANASLLVTRATESPVTREISA